MQVEDSYEGAVRRLSRLSHAGVDLLPSRHDDAEAQVQQRLRDLEELANLATEENERLERELMSARETIQRLQEQLTSADRQRLREIIESAPAPARRRSLRPLLVAVSVLGVLAAGVTLRPWQYAPAARAWTQQQLLRHATHPWAMPLPPPAPVVVAPAPAPAPAPKVVAPPVVAAAVAPQPAPEKRKHAKRHRRAEAPKAPKAHAAAVGKPAGKDLDSILGL
jgi:hypothetical protein